MVASDRIGRGGGDERRLRIALFLAGFATFSLLWCVQPLLPAFHDRFRTSPAGASLALSLATACLAGSILCTTPLAARLGRPPVMAASMILASLCNIAAALAPDWPVLLLLRAIEGILLGGVPAVAMAHLAEEIDPADLGAVMGLYVGGTAFGGMVGRVGAALVAEHSSWRWAMAGTGAAGLMAGIVFVLLLPPARTEPPSRTHAADRHGHRWTRHVRDPTLAGLFLSGLLAMGTFVTVYDYLGFRLMRRPFTLTQGEAGLVFMMYLFGIVASPVAGRISSRSGRAPVLVAGQLLGLLGVALTLVTWLPAIMAGLALITVGFFVSHSIASAWVGHRAVLDRGHAASLYLLAYYAGASLMGPLGGWFWSAAAWPGVVGFTSFLLLLGLATSLLLARQAGPGHG